jgi:hypothetical protein
MRNQLKQKNNSGISVPVFRMAWKLLSQVVQMLCVGRREPGPEEESRGEPGINRVVHEPIDISRLEKAVEERVPEAGGRTQNRRDQDCIKWVSL